VSKGKTVSRKLIVATRKSQLALAQTRAWIRELERVTGAATEELLVTTSGDRVQDVALSKIGGKGLFVKEIEDALLERRADLAVHSMKDVPGELPSGLVIGCVPEREDPRDVLVTRDGRAFDALAAGSKVGSSSLRRQTFLRLLRADLEYVALRGNVDTRLRKCAEGVVDAVVLARAGLRRLGLDDRVTEVLEPSKCLPAIGQGALAIEHRRDDQEVADLVKRVSHLDTAIAVAAERGVMVAVEGSCQIPVAAYGIREGGELWLRGMLAEPDGTRARFREVRAPWPASDVDSFEVGRRLGEELRRA
jgi:hydroxymethylbilane synthase